jgi:protoporphyrinogen oxidase
MMNEPETTTTGGTPRSDTPSQKKTWAVIGGGMLGLATAYELAKQGYRVTLFESASTIGGLTSQWQIGDVTWDRFYHVTLLSDVYLRQLLRELECESQIDWVTTRTGFYSDGQLHSLSSSIDFLKFPILNLVQKFRLGSTIFFGSKRKDWRSLERISVESWLRKWSGNSTFEKIWLPLLKCKLGPAYERTNAAFIWAYIQRMYAARRTGMRREMFGMVQGGYANVLSLFHKRLESMGVDIRLNTSVRSVARVPNDKVSYEVTCSAKDVTKTESFDRVIGTLPSPALLRILKDLSTEERSRLGETEYLGVLCTSLLLDGPLGGYYVTNITDPGIPLTGVIETGSMLPPEKLNGHYLVYLPNYKLANDDAFDETDEVIHERCIATLEQMYPKFHRDQVRAIQTARAKYVMAIPTLNYSEKRANVVAKSPGLYLLNSARIVDGTLNVNEILRLVYQELPNILAADERLPLV